MVDEWRIEMVSTLNGIEAIELLETADPAAASAVRFRGRKPVVERTADQPYTINGVEGVIFSDETGGPGTVFRLDEADWDDAQAARQRGQRVLVVVDENGEVVASGVTLPAASVSFVPFDEHSAEGTLVGTVTYHPSATWTLTNTAGNRFKKVDPDEIHTGAVETDYETTPEPQIEITQSLEGAVNTPRVTSITVTSMVNIAGDTTPDAFSFVDTTDVVASSTQTSGWVQITGLSTEPSTVTVGGDASSEWRKADDGSGTNATAWGSAAGTILNNKYVQVRHTASANTSTATNTILTIGGVSDTFTSTTAAGGAPADWGVPKIGAVASVASGNLTLTEPAGAASGDLMVACIGYRDSAAFTLPAGWTIVATQQSSGNLDSGGVTTGIPSACMAYIVRGGSAPSLVWTRTAGDVASGVILGYTGADNTPYDTGSSNTLGTASTTSTTGTITTAAVDELLVAMSCSARTTIPHTFRAATSPTTSSGGSGVLDTTTAPSDDVWLGRLGSAVTTGADIALAIADVVKTVAGATGEIRSTAANSRGVMVVGAFRPPFDDGGGEAPFGATIVGAPSG
jgi:hypothetical protein